MMHTGAHAPRWSWLFTSRPATAVDTTGYRGTTRNTLALDTTTMAGLTRGVVRTDRPRTWVRREQQA